MSEQDTSSEEIGKEFVEGGLQEDISKDQMQVDASDEEVVVGEERMAEADAEPEPEPGIESGSGFGSSSENGGSETGSEDEGSVDSKSDEEESGMDVRESGNVEPKSQEEEAGDGDQNLNSRDDGGSPDDEESEGLPTEPEEEDESEKESAEEDGKSGEENEIDDGESGEEHVTDKNNDVDSENESDEEKDKSTNDSDAESEMSAENSEESGEEESSSSESGSDLELNTENVDVDLLRRQTDFIMESGMLNNPTFRTLSNNEKIASILALLNSKPELAMPGLSGASGTPGAPGTVPTTSSQGANGATEEPRKAKFQRADLSSPMTAREAELYSEYLRGESRITEMHNIPMKSRLFIGNLPLKNVTKEDLFRIFSPYGHILQINIKNAFGFIQYDNPQSVKDAIEYETDHINFGKKLILEISSSNARPQFDHGDHGTNSSSTFISTSKRPFHTDDTGDIYGDNGMGALKKAKRRVPQCVIYVKRTADRSYASEIFNSIKNGTGLETDMIFLKPRMELRKMINGAAFDGTWGVILVNKTHNVDIQTFYKGPQGEIKFDEFISVSGDDAVSIFNNLKVRRQTGPQDMAATPPPLQVGSNPYGTNYGQPAMGPQQGQGYYGGYGMQQQMPPQQGYGYGVPPPQGYGAPTSASQAAPVGQGYGRYQNSPVQPQVQMNQGFGRYQPMSQQQPPPVQGQIPLNQQQSQLSNILGGGTNQMDQQQILAAIQNLPPNVISSLLSAAQQQQQQQQVPQPLPPQQQQQQQQPAQAQNSNAQQQLFSLIQNMSNTGSQQGYPQMGQQPGASIPGREGSQQPPQQQAQRPNPGNNFQSLLDSLAKLQK